MSNPKGYNQWTYGTLKAKGKENAVSIRSYGGDHPGDRSYLRKNRASGGGKGNMPADREKTVSRDEMADGIRWARAGMSGPAPRRGGPSRGPSGEAYAHAQSVNARSQAISMDPFRVK